MDGDRPPRVEGDGPPKLAATCLKAIAPAVFGAALVSPAIDDPSYRLSPGPWPSSPLATCISA